jgi:hypothetical protein
VLGFESIEKLNTEKTGERREGHGERTARTIAFSGAPAIVINYRDKAALILDWRME